MTSTDAMSRTHFPDLAVDPPLTHGEAPVHPLVEASPDPLDPVADPIATEGRAHTAPVDDASILFVCTGNVSRSSFMHLVFRELVTDAGLRDITVQSGGLQAAVGAEPHPEVRSWLQSHSFEHAGFRARQVTPADVSGAAVVLTATRRQRDLVVRMVPSAVTKTFTLLQLNRLLKDIEQGPTGYDREIPDLVRLARRAHAQRGLVPSAGVADDVEDPTGRNHAAFVSAFALIHSSLSALANHLEVHSHPSTSRKGNRK